MIQYLFWPLVILFCIFLAWLFVTWLKANGFFDDNEDEL